MKQICSFLLVLTLLLTSCFSSVAYAAGDGNIDGGGGGMGNGTNQNFWNPGDEGVRITVIRTSDHRVVTTPIDFTNKKPNNIQACFGKISKMSYTRGSSLNPSGQKYAYINPAKALPRIISEEIGNGNIQAIKNYFTDELVVKYIARVTGMNYSVLINGSYKILIEPIAYITFKGVRVALTATEAALYDEKLGGELSRRMWALSHQNLPLSMFLEVADLGYPVWSGSKTSRASDADIKSSLGLGIVRFGQPEPVKASTNNYTYRVNTEVITSVTVSGGQADPDNPVSVRFTMGSKTYTVNNVYYPDGDSQLVWVRWTTPSTPQAMTIRVSVSGRGKVSQNTITANIVDLSGKDPPNPVADDRNSSYTQAGIPTNAQAVSASWGIWTPKWHADWVWYSTGSGKGYWHDHGWWDFDYNSYRASLIASMNIMPDAKVPTALGKTMKSGYGISETVATGVTTNLSSAVTGAQTALTYFPEFKYQTYWRLLDKMSNGLGTSFEFKKNKYSTYNRRTHFTPIWFPNGNYTPYTYLLDCWTPSGMLSMNLSDTVTISGNLWSDWHCAPVKP